MITNSLSVNGRAHKKGFSILTAFIAVLFVCSVTVTAFAAASAYTQVTVTDGEKSVSISAKSVEPKELVIQAGFTLGANDELDLTDYSEDEGGTIVIKRANVIRIADNGLISYLVGYGDTLGDILGDEGIVINGGDEIGQNLSKRIFDGMKVAIKRAFTVSVTSDGETSKLAMASGTVADAIEKAGIILNGDDIVRPSLDTVLNGFTQIKILRVRYETRSETQPVEFDTKTVPSADMYIDESELVTAGVNGEKLVFYTEKYIDGVLDETVFSKEIVTKEPVTQVKKVGTQKKAVLSAFKNNQAPISDLNVPASLELDENGIPVNYEYCVEGKATAYSGDPATASGRTPMPGHIAVDPKEFPYGTELYVVSADGSYVYGYCIAADTGGFVAKGNTDIDLYMDTEEMCSDWGVRGVKIYVLN